VTAAPAGAEVGLYYDARRDVAVGDVVETTRTKRRYLVMKVRRQERGRHAGRWHLRCVVLPPDADVDPDAVIHPVRWYRRESKGSR
jgi:hypothetical protein